MFVLGVRKQGARRLMQRRALFQQTFRACDCDALPSFTRIKIRKRGKQSEQSLFVPVLIRDTLSTWYLQRKWLTGRCLRTERGGKVTFGGALVLFAFTIGISGRGARRITELKRRDSTCISENHTFWRFLAFHGSWDTKIRACVVLNFWVIYGMANFYTMRNCQSKQGGLLLSQSRPTDFNTTELLCWGLNNRKEFCEGHKSRTKCWPCKKNNNLQN